LLIGALGGDGGAGAGARPHSRKNEAIWDGKLFFLRGLACFLKKTIIISFVGVVAGRVFGAIGGEMRIWL